MRGTVFSQNSQKRSKRDERKEESKNGFGDTRNGDGDGCARDIAGKTGGQYADRTREDPG